MNTTLTSSVSALPPMIDTHCHLDDHQFSDDLADVLSRSRDSNVKGWVLIGYDPIRWENAVAMSNTTPGMSHTLGVHPSCADQWNDDLGYRLRDLAVDSGAVGIGEAGLDFYRDNASLEIQATAFSAQLSIATQLKLPLVIHMRDAESEMLQLLESTPTLPTLIFHSFDGGDQLMDYVLKSDSYVGIGGLATRQKSDMLRRLLAKVPMNRILLETDSPYLVPARQKDRRNQPMHIATIASMMAEHFGTSPAELASITTTNAKRVFGMHHE